jgi:hypothetical protein
MKDYKTIRASSSYSNNASAKRRENSLLSRVYCQSKDCKSQAVIYLNHYLWCVSCAIQNQVKKLVGGEQ